MSELHTVPIGYVKTTYTAPDGTVTTKLVPVTTVTEWARVVRDAIERDGDCRP